jgi:hypothetical protein
MSLYNSLGFYPDTFESDKLLVTFLDKPNKLISVLFANKNFSIFADLIAKSKIFDYLPIETTRYTIFAFSDNSLTEQVKKAFQVLTIDQIIYIAKIHVCKHELNLNPSSDNTSSQSDSSLFSYPSLADNVQLIFDMRDRKIGISEQTYKQVKLIGSKMTGHGIIYQISGPLIPDTNLTN